MNYTDRETPYTRIIEHKHFELLCQGAKAGTVPKTVITREYPAAKGESDEPYYPMNDEKNNALYARYKELADAQPNVIFGGRLGQRRVDAGLFLFDKGTECDHGQMRIKLVAEDAVPSRIRST